jgi:hypothetical protein
MFFPSILVTIAVLCAMPLSLANPVVQDTSITVTASNVPAASAIAPIDTFTNAADVDDLEAADVECEESPAKLRYRQEDLIDLAADDEDEAEVEDAGANVLDILAKRADCRVERKKGVRGDCHASQCKPDEQCKLNKTGRGCVWKKAKKSRPYACSQCKCQKQN